MRFAALALFSILAVCVGCSQKTSGGSEIAVAADTGNCPTTVDPAVASKPLPSDLPHAGKPVKFEHPLYPSCAGGRGVSGVVDFALTVAADGAVRDAQVIQEVPAGFGFAKSGLDVLPRWRFEPKLIDGKPVESRSAYRMTFKFYPSPPDPVKAADEKVVVTGYRIVRWDQLAGCPAAPDPKTLVVQPPPAEISETGTALMQVPPEFPLCAEHNGVGGVVDLVFTVQPDGSVGEIQVAQEVPTGFGLAAAAVEAVSQWKYRPKLDDGKAVAFRTRARFNLMPIGHRR